MSLVVTSKTNLARVGLFLILIKRHFNILVHMYVFRLWLSNLIYNFCLYSDTCQEVLDCPKLADFRCVQVFCKAFLSQISYGFNVYDFFITSFLFFFREVFLLHEVSVKEYFYWRTFLLTSVEYLKLNLIYAITEDILAKKKKILRGWRMRFGSQKFVTVRVLGSEAPPFLINSFEFSKSSAFFNKLSIMC